MASLISLCMILVITTLLVFTAAKDGSMLALDSGNPFPVSTIEFKVPVLQTNSSGSTFLRTETHGGVVTYATDSAGSTTATGSLVDLGVLNRPSMTSPESTASRIQGNSTVTSNLATINSTVPFAAPVRPTMDVNLDLTLTLSSATSTSTLEPLPTTGVPDPCWYASHICGTISIPGQNTTTTQSYVGTRLCSNGTLTLNSSSFTPVDPDGRWLTHSSMLKGVGCRELYIPTEPNRASSFRIAPGYRCVFYDRLECEMGGRFMTRGEDEREADGYLLNVRSYKCFWMEEWAKGFNWERFYIDSEGRGV